MNKGYIALIIVFFAVLALAFSVQFRFSLGEELRVSLSPQDISMSTYNGRPVHVDFTLSVENFVECGASCDILMKDLRNDEIIEEKTLVLDSSQNLSYTLTPSKLGSGQALYKLDVQCHNIPSIICRTDGAVKHKSAIAAVNYELSDTQVELRERIKPILESWLYTVAEREARWHALKNLSSRMSFGTPYSDVSELLDIEYSSFSSLKDKEVEVLSVWEEQDYTALSVYDFNLSTSKFDLIESMILDELSVHNDNIELITRMHKLELRFNSSGLYNKSLFILFNKTSNAVLGDVRVLNLSSVPERALNVRLSEQFVVMNNTLNELVRLNVSCNKINQSDNSTLNVCPELPIRLNVSLDKKDLTIPSYEVAPSPLPETAPLCCVSQVCRVCSSLNPTPVLFIHGHGFNARNTPDYSMVEFALLQRKLEDFGYIDAGELDITSDIGSGDWGQAGLPLALRGSYYFIRDYDFAGRSIYTRQSERIENYALRLRELIETLKFRTSSDRVDIVAHSMGGLVLREYINIFGNQSVDKIIFINVPHNGTRDPISRYCGIIGSDKECEDMASGSLFLRRLNAQPIRYDALNIISTGCDMDLGAGDGVVLIDDAYLEGVENVYIEGSCTDSLGSDLHTNVLNPNLHPEVFDLLREYLSRQMGLKVN